MRTDRCDGIAEVDAALQKTDTAPVLEPVHCVQLGAEIQVGKNLGREQTLIRQIVNCEDRCCSVERRMITVRRCQVYRRQSSLPVVEVHDFQCLTRPDDPFERCARQEGEAHGVVRIVFIDTAIQELTIVEFRAIDEHDPDTFCEIPDRVTHLELAPADLQPVVRFWGDPSVAATVPRQRQGHIVPEARERVRECAGDIGQATRFRIRLGFGSDHQHGERRHLEESASVACTYRAVRRVWRPRGLLPPWSVVHNRWVPRPPPRSLHGEPREITELEQLKEDNPQLANAVDLQISLLELQRRVQARVPLPPVSAEHIRTRDASADGLPLLRFDEIPLDWTDFRLLFRETAELLRRHETLDDSDYQRALVIVRDGNALKPIVAAWYGRAAAAYEEAKDPFTRPASPDMLDQVIQLAMRPFLARCAEAFLPHIEQPARRRGRCPLCGGEPEFSTITPAAERFLICGRCTGQWLYEPLACPFCSNADRASITSFATRDGRYRIYACDACLRYLKTYDSRSADRPVLAPVDTIATLPLDAVVMQRGYRSE